MRKSILALACVASFVFFGCKKSPIYDARVAGTWSTNMNYDFEMSGVARNQNFPDLDPPIFAEDVSQLFPLSTTNFSLFGQGDIGNGLFPVEYKVNLYLNTATIEPKTYLYNATNISETGRMTADVGGQVGSWIWSGRTTVVSSIASYTRFTFTKVYTKNYETGPVKLCDGNYEAVMVGGQGGAINSVTLTGSFTGIVIL